MKLLLASSTLNVKNGYGNITYELVSALHELGHQITLLLPIDDSFQEYDIDGVKIERVLPNYIFNYKTKKSISHFLWNYKTKETYDIVHSLFAFPYAPLMCREAKRLKVPFIMGAQGTYGVQPLAQFPENVFMKYAYKNAKAVIVPSEYTKNAILNEAGETYDITVIHNGVNFDRFNKHEVKNETLRAQFKDRKVLLTVGELKSRKGQDLVIRALPEIIKAHPNVLYVMAGYPSWQNHLEDLAKELGVEQHILITGAVDDSEVLDYFHLCDVYVHTPRVHDKFQFEGFGIVYIEAGASRKPAVGADAGGIRDALVHQKTGLVAENENVDQITRYINELLDKEELLREYGVNAEKYALEHDWKNIVKHYESKYLSVIN